MSYSNDIPAEHFDEYEQFLKEIMTGHDSKADDVFYPEDSSLPEYDSSPEYDPSLEDDPTSEYVLDKGTLRAVIYSACYWDKDGYLIEVNEHVDDPTSLMILTRPNKTNPRSKLSEKPKVDKQSCRNGDKCYKRDCLFDHPGLELRPYQCRNGDDCFKESCSFDHPGLKPRTFKKHVGHVSKVGKPACRHGKACYTKNCPFDHSVSEKN